MEKTVSIEDGWVDVDGEIPDGIIRTHHFDGKEDVCKVVGGVIYSYDPVTDAPITHYKPYKKN